MELVSPRRGVMSMGRAGPAASSGRLRVPVSSARAPEPSVTGSRPASASRLDETDLDAPGGLVEPVGDQEAGELPCAVFALLAPG